MNAVWRDDNDDGAEADRAVEEREIMVRAQRDLAAFAPLYEHYYRPVFGYCHRRLAHREAAADAASQTFARALAGIDGFRSGSVPAWLFTIARNVVIDTVRSRRFHLGIDAAVHVPDSQPLPEDEVVAHDQQRALFAALRTLTPDQRHVVELRLAGLTSPEIAAVLGTTPGAVKASQHRAYARLRTALAGEHIFGDPT